MILSRQKLFVGLQDGFGGKKGRIKRTRIFKRSPSYKKFGPWDVDLSENAYDEYQEFDDKQQKKIDLMLAELRTKPFQGSFGQHPLWEFYDEDNECVVWSAEIDEENRMNYLIFKQTNTILITNLLGHNIIDIEYAK